MLGVELEVCEFSRQQGLITTSASISVGDELNLFGSDVGVYWRRVFVHDFEVALEFQAWLVVALRSDFPRPIRRG